MRLIHSYSAMDGHRRTRSFFTRSLLLSIVLVLLPVSILGSFFLKGSNESIRNETSALVQGNLEQTSDLIDTLFVDSNFIAASISLSPDMDDFLYAETDKDMEVIAWNIMNQLKTFAHTKWHIQSVYAYSGTNATVLTPYSMVPFDQFLDQSWHQSYVRSEHGTPYRVRRTTMSDDVDMVSVIKPLFTDAGTRRVGAVIVNIDLSRLNETINGESELYRLVISEEDGSVLLGESSGELDITQDTTAMFQDIDGETHIVISRISERTGLHYVLSVPLAHFDEGRIRMRNLILILLTVGILAFGASIILTVNSYRPIRNLKAVFEHPANAAMSGFKTEEVRGIADKIVRTIQVNRDLRTELDQRLSLLDRTKTAALQAQINPHFVNNTLETIRWGAVALTDGENRVSEMASDLASLLRLSLETEETVIRLDEEIQHARLYAKLIAMRYEGKLSIKWTVEDRVRDCRVVKLSLQPLIENAFYHGIKPTRRPGVITIAGFKDGENLRVRVSDDGRGMSSESLEIQRNRLEAAGNLSSEHIGLGNVNQRIKLVFGDEFGLSISSIEGDGTTLEMVLPFVASGL